MWKFLSNLSRNRILVRAAAPEIRLLATLVLQAAILAIRPLASGKVLVTPFPVGATVKPETAPALRVPVANKLALAQLGELAYVTMFTAALRVRRALSRVAPELVNPTAAVMNAPGKMIRITVPIQTLA